MRYLAVITRHDHGGRSVPAAIIRRTPRCTMCGHRLTVDGIPPRQTREEPWRLAGELRGRHLARKAGRP